LTVPFVDLRVMHEELDRELREAIHSVVRSGDFILGEAVAKFEEEWAAYCGVRHAVGTDSGLSALELALRAYGIGPGDEVVTAANTFIATAFAVMHTGATPVLVDADPDTLNMDASRLAEAITPRTRAVIPVHLYGQPADMDAIRLVADAHDLIVIEDACQAHGARYRGRRAGALGHAAAFSFYPAKNLGAFGDGGVVVTDDAEIAERIRALRHYGQREKNEHGVVGYNRRLDTLQAACLQLKLARLDNWNDDRRAAAEQYDLALANAGVKVPASEPDVEHVWHLYVVRTSRREELRAHLTASGIATGIHYPVPVHLQPACSDLGYRPGDFPVSEAAANEILSLPMYPGLDEPAVQRVAGSIRALLGSANGNGAGNGHGRRSRARAVGVARAGG
jgi:dTDP-4-amino-4,6-dideoxygalactose transaminase